MSRNELGFWISVVSALCWIVCFWWMHRISTRQDALLAALQEQASRIEELSKTEHDLIREVHPQVGEIKDTVTKVAASVVDEPRDKSSRLPK
jgi:cell division protein FtsB